MHVARTFLWAGIWLELGIFRGRMVFSNETITKKKNQNWELFSNLLYHQIHCSIRYGQCPKLFACFNEINWSCYWLLGHIHDISNVCGERIWLSLWKNSYVYEIVYRFQPGDPEHEQNLSTKIRWTSVAETINGDIWEKTRWKLAKNDGQFSG